MGRLSVRARSGVRSKARCQGTLRVTSVYELGEGAVGGPLPLVRRTDSRRSFPATMPRLVVTTAETWRVRWAGHCDLGDYSVVGQLEHTGGTPDTLVAERDPIGHPGA